MADLCRDLGNRAIGARDRGSNSIGLFQSAVMGKYGKYDLDGYSCNMVLAHIRVVGAVVVAGGDRVCQNRVEARMGRHAVEPRVDRRVVGPRMVEHRTRGSVRGHMERHHVVVGSRKQDEVGNHEVAGNGRICHHAGNGRMGMELVGNDRMANGQEVGRGRVDLHDIRGLAHAVHEVHEEDDVHAVHDVRGVREVHGAHGGHENHKMRALLHNQHHQSQLRFGSVRETQMQL